ncbi:hypothetical protein APHAL10511_006936 [Amanita phalloides]|nr:hypothetical protein APHAL10511_006936 [Amanita phalloides]
MEHTLHVACKHFVKTIAPASPHAICKKVKDALKCAGLDGELDIDQFDDELVGLRLDGSDNGDNGDNHDHDDIEFPPGEALGKALVLVKQIWTSAQARAFFQSSCIQVGLPPLELLLWVHTRWGSLYTFLDRILDNFMKAVDQFVLLADASDKVPDLPRDRLYADFQLSKKDWDRLEVIQDVLREPSDVQQTFSKECDPTVWHIIPSLEFLIKCWQTMADHP